jgi:hypothetical protein
MSSLLTTGRGGASAPTQGGSDSFTPHSYTRLQGHAGESSGDHMIRPLNISSYRGFSDFNMGDLGRVNFLVGRNNSGKISVLEALYLLSTTGGAFAF